MDAYGVNVDPAALMAASSVYLNATETDIGAFLSLANGGGVKAVADASAFDFGFYTQVVGTDANSNPVVVNIGQTITTPLVTAGASMHQMSW